MSIKAMRDFAFILLLLVYGSKCISTRQTDSDPSSLAISKINSNGCIQQYGLNTKNDNIESPFEISNKIAIYECDMQNVLSVIVDSINTTTSFVLLRNDCKKFASELFQTHICWARGKLDDEAVVLCGHKNLQLLLTFNLISLKNERNILQSNIQRQKALDVSLWPSIFAEASEEIDKKTRQKRRTAQPKRKSKHVKVSSDKRNDENELSDKTEDDEPVELQEKSEEVTHTSNDDNNSNEATSSDNPELETDDETPTTKEDDAKNDVDDNDSKSDENLDKDQLRLLCKYRHSCYKERGFADKLVNEKEAKKMAKPSILTTKPSSLNESPKKYKKVTTAKDAAADALRKMEEKKKMSSSKPKISRAEKLLSDVKQQQTSKNACKYRKSCYETGKIPEIEQSKILQKIPFVSNYFDNNYVEQQKREVNSANFEDLTDQEQKYFCKYRKSCYNSGKLPELQGSKTFNYMEVLENGRKEIPIQMRCKYRKSCYETGVPSAEFDKKEVHDKTKTNDFLVHPTTIDELKLFCKYRKSCYLKMSENVNDEIPKIVEDNESENENDDGKVEEVDEEDENDNEKNEEQVEEDKNSEEKEEFQKDTKIVIEKKQKINKKVEAHVKEHNLQELKSRKLKTEEFCEKLADNEQFKSALKDNAPIVKRLKGKQPTQRPTDEELSENDIIVISNKHHLRKWKKNADDDEESDGVIEEETDAVIEEAGAVVEELDAVVDEESDKEEKSSTKEEAMENEIEDVPAEVFEVKKENNENLNDVKLVTFSKNPDLDSKLACKYRKSCYSELGLYSDREDDKEHPKTILYKSAPQQKMNSEMDWSRIRKEEQLKCKYRKSCYNAQEEFNDGSTFSQIATEKIRKPKPNSDKDHPKTILYKSAPQQKMNSEMDWSRIRKEEQLKCKYRKSCYDAQAIEEEFNDGSTLSQLATEKIRKPKANSKSQHNHQHQNAEPNNKHDNIENKNELSKEIRHQCKYRHSCYKTISPDYEFSGYDVAKNESRVNPVTENIIEDKNQQVFILPDGTSCSKYRISCQTQMGLPPKERAPIGPNGRKLCRKKKVEGNKKE